MKNININTFKKTDLLYIFMVIAISGALLIYTKNDFYVFIAASIFVLFLSFKRPVLFLLVTFTWLTVRYMFSLQAGSYFSGGAGISSWVKGDLFLNFLRVASPNNNLIKHLPKVFFLGATAYIFHMKLIYKNRRRILSNNYDKFVMIFIIIVLASAIANIKFFGVIFFLYKFLYSIVFFYYIKFNDFRIKKNVMLFYYLLFLCFEAQVSFTLIQNVKSIIKGNPFFGDNAIGTFVFPLEELSISLMVIAFLFFLSRYFFERDKKDLINLIIIFFMILFASVILTTIYLLLFLFFFILFNQKKLKLKFNKIVYLAGFLLVLFIPIYIFMTSNYTRYAGNTILRNIEQKANKDIFEFGKIYAFKNLYDMVTTENKYFLGSGPGTFLSSAGLKYQSILTTKYGSWNIYRKDRLSSSDRLENSFVGLVGEIGLLGWLLYIVFLLKIISNMKPKYCYNKYMYLVVFKNAVILYFIGMSFFRNIFEAIEVMPIAFALIALVDTYIKNVDKKALKNV